MLGLGLKRRISSQCQRQISTSNLPSLLAAHAQTPTRAVTLSKLLSFGFPLTEESVIASASYSLSEIPRRLARRILALEKLPYIVGTNPFVARTLESFKESFEWIVGYGEVRSVEENEEFVRELEKLVERHGDDIPRMAKGFQECTRYMTPIAMNTFLDSAIRNRISVRLIAGQHISLSHALHGARASNLQKKPIEVHDSGVVDMSCSPVELINACDVHVREMCEATFGVAPAIIVDGHVDARFAYVPAHMQYILSELLKNAYRATVENHWKLNGASTRSRDLPPVRITVSLPPKTQDTPSSSFHGTSLSSDSSSGMTNTRNLSPRRALSLRIRDQGGGVPPTNTSRIFSYAFTTASHLKRGAYVPPSSPQRLRNVESNSNPATGFNYDADSQEGGLSGPYAAQHMAGGISMGSGVGTIAGLGYGLPMSRLYARYFGGELDLISMDGWGTDVFVKLSCLDEAGDAEI